jgi:N-acyl-L-homoserine lactone synthetase
MSDDSAALRWELRSLGESSEPESDWLHELSEIRGRVLYAEGRRPSFRLWNGTFADCDPLDMHAYHVIAREPTGTVVGCIRLVPLTDATECITEEIVGKTLFNKALDELGVSRSLAAECSRWIVVRELRSTLLGMRLIAGIIAFGRQLGYRILIGPTGVRDGQAALLGRIGMQPVPYLSSVEVPRYDDELEFLYLDPCRVEPKFTRTINKMARRLELDRVLKPNRRGAALLALSLGGK